MQFVCKKDYWAAEKIVEEHKVNLSHSWKWHIKEIQDKVCFKLLTELNLSKNKIIGEIGGGKSRLLKILADKSNKMNVII